MRIAEVNNDEKRYEKDIILTFKMCKISGHIVFGWKILNEITESYGCPCYRHIFMILNIIWTKQ